MGRARHSRVLTHFVPLVFIILCFLLSGTLKKHFLFLFVAEICQFARTNHLACRGGSEGTQRRSVSWLFFPCHSTCTSAGSAVIKVSSLRTSSVSRHIIERSEISDEICLFKECAVVRFESGFNGEEVKQGKGRTQCAGRNGFMLLPRCWTEDSEFCLFPGLPAGRRSLLCSG